MISIVLYGRNDSYGYNLHKRAALSLNCMAEVLTDPSDEILFVDYNTPDDFPTFPEAIQDTLTRRAKEMLRVFRVRPQVHGRFSSKTRLLALEPIARNVAVRRSSASNRWILSTNTDMIFVPLRERSLSRLAQRLAPGFYHTPRLEIPEVLWESLKRSDPVAVIKTVRTWGSSLHLNEIVLGSKVILYDGPGDFQLLLRSDLFENQGFDEEMLLGWHVDSNIAARMHFKYGHVGDLGSDVYGYHCDHTRQVTPAHSHARLQNDWRRFVSEIGQSDIPGQAQYWGCVEDDIEEVRLSAKPSSIYVQALQDAIGEPLRAPNVVEYGYDTYDKVDYDPRHVLPFLADLFAPMPRDTNLAWYSVQAKMLMIFASTWKKLGFTGKILLDAAKVQAGLEIDAISHVSTSTALAEADAFVFDFGGLSPYNRADVTTPEIALRKSFLRAVRTERERLSSGRPLRRIIALNAINNEYEGFFTGFVGAPATPFSTHIRHGFVFETAKQDWLPLLAIGEAGSRVGAQIKTNPIKSGWVAFGPSRYLHQGSYIVTAVIELLSCKVDRLRNEPCVCIEVRAGSQLLALRLFRYGDLGNTEHRLGFALSQDMAGVVGIETRIATLTPIAVAVRKLTVEPASPSVEIDEAPDVLDINDWIPYLRIGPLGQFNEKGVTAQTGHRDFVVFGPYWTLPLGRYEMNVRIECGLGTSVEHMVRADVTVGDQQLAAGNFHLSALPSDGETALKTLRLRFTLEGATPEARQIETRIWSSGEAQFTIDSLSVKAVGHHTSEDLLPLLLIGEVGQRLSGEIRNVDQQAGFIAYTPTIPLKTGAYKLSHQIVVRRGRDNQNGDNDTCAILIVRQGPYILAVDAINSASGQSEEKNITFGVMSRPDQPNTVEFLLQVVAPADVRLKTLSFEPTAAAVPSTGLAAFQIENWLPFMQKQPDLQIDPGGFVVGENTIGFVFWGPYWTLPVGWFEVIAVIVPGVSNRHAKPVVMLDVSSEGGQRLIAQHQWYLGQSLPANPQETLVCRLPFELGANLPAEVRTIETRISTLGGSSFHVRSLQVRPVSADEFDLFRYLTVRDCGLHTGNSIRSLANKIGCIACTPPIHVEEGRYEARLCLADTRTDPAKIVNVGEITLEIQSGPNILAIHTYKLERGLSINKVLTFDVIRDRSAVTPIEVTIQSTSPSTVSISAAHLIKVSNDVPTGLASSRPGEPWTVRFRLGAVGRATQNGVLAREGLAGLVGYMLAPYQAGRYEIVLRVKRAGQKGNPYGKLTVSAGNLVLASRSFDFHSLRPVPRGPFRFCSFNAPVDAARKASTIQIRVDSTGLAPFLIKSIALSRRTRWRETRDLAYQIVRTILTRMHVA